MKRSADADEVYTMMVTCLTMGIGFQIIKYCPEPRLIAVCMLGAIIWGILASKVWEWYP